MSFGVSTGYSSITMYEITWDQGNSTWVSNQNVSSTYAQITSGITSGGSYVFAITPYNVYGKGSTSSPNFTIIASVAPGQMDPLVTDMVPGTNLVKFSWSPPTIGAGSIDQYNILFYDKNSNSYLN